MEFSSNLKVIGLQVDREDTPSVTTGDIRIRWLVNYQDDDVESPPQPAGLSETLRTVLERLYSNGTLKRTDSLWVVPLDNDARRMELIGAGRLRFDDHLAHYPAYFAPGKITVVNVVRAGTIAETGTLMEATRGVVVQNSFANTDRDPQRYNTDAITLTSLSDVPLTDLVVVTYSEGRNFIVSRNDLQTRIAQNVRRMPVIEQTITGDRDVRSPAETAARQRLLDQLAQTAGQPLARVSAIGELPRPVFPRDFPDRTSQRLQSEIYFAGLWERLLDTRLTSDEEFKDIRNFFGLDINGEITHDEEEGFRDYDFLHSLPDYYLKEGETQSMIDWLNAGGNPKVTESRLDYYENLDLEPNTMWSADQAWPYITQVIVNGKGSVELRTKLARMLGVAGADVSVNVLGFTRLFIEVPNQFVPENFSEEEKRVIMETFEFLHQLANNPLETRIFKATTTGHSEDIPLSLKTVENHRAVEFRNYESLVYMSLEDMNTIRRHLTMPYPADVVAQFRRSEMNSGVIKVFLDLEYGEARDSEENDDAPIPDQNALPPNEEETTDETLLEMARAGQMAQIALYVYQNPVSNEQITTAANAAQTAGHQEIADYLGNLVNRGERVLLQRRDDDGSEDEDDSYAGDFHGELPEWAEYARFDNWRLLDELRRNGSWSPEDETYNEMTALSYASDHGSFNVLQYLLLFGNYPRETVQTNRDLWSNDLQTEMVYVDNYDNLEERQRQRGEWLRENPGWQPLEEYGYAINPEEEQPRQQTTPPAATPLRRSARLARLAGQTPPRLDQGSMDIGAVLPVFLRKNKKYI